MVARLVRDQEAGGSSPPTPTKHRDFATFFRKISVFFVFSAFSGTSLSVAVHLIGKIAYEFPERGKITEETKAIPFPFDGFSDVNADAVQAAADELALLLRRFFGDGIEIETGTVTKDAPRFDFF